MKTIKFTGYLFYRYYLKGPRASIPYFSTLCSMTLLGFMNLLLILILLDKVDLIPINLSDGKGTKQIVIFWVMLPIYLAMTFLIRKKDLVAVKEEYDNNWDKVFKGNVWLVLYIIASFASVFIAAVLKG